MVELQKQLPKLEKAGVRIVGVSYDSPEVLKKLSEKEKISFPLLSDQDSKVIRAYGLLNIKAKGRRAGIPHPGTLVVDSQGVVRAKLFVSVYERHTPQQLLDAIKAITAQSDEGPPSS